MNIEISSSFKSSTRSAVFAISLFALTYLVLSLITIAICIGCVMLAIGLILLKIHFATILFVIGLLSFGGLLGIFLFKFIFTIKKTDTSQFKLLSENEEPKLYALIREISEAAHTSFPGKIFLSADVNAFVFYDSTFWSMFFPVKKNLVIGVGLMNSLTSQELKAVLAHEFGHFSQKSMRVGSYVHQVQLVMQNILFENNSYGNFARQLHSIHPIVGLFVNLAIGVLNGIIWILKKIYRLVYLKYLGLSREMEFHADQFAAQIAGSEYFKRSMIRLEYAGGAFQNVLIFYQQKQQQSLRPDDLYAQHLEALTYAGKVKGTLFHCGLPLFDKLPNEEQNFFRISFEENWNTHPETAERIAAAQPINPDLRISDEFPSIQYLSNEKGSKQILTDLTFSQMVGSNQSTVLTTSEFMAAYKQQMEIFQHDEMYAGYWDLGSVISLDEKEIEEQPILKFEELFNKEVTNMLLRQQARAQELNTLHSISDKQSGVRHFIFNGKKYSTKQSQAVSNLIETEENQAAEEIMAHARKITAYFIRLAEQQNAALEFKNALAKLKKYDENATAMIRIYQEIQWRAHQVFQGGNVEQIFGFINHLEAAESELRQDIKIRMQSGDYREWITPEAERQFQAYGKNQMKYFNGEKFDDDLVKYLFEVLQEYQNLAFKPVQEIRALIITKMTDLQKAAIHRPS